MWLNICTFKCSHAATNMYGFMHIIMYASMYVYLNLSLKAFYLRMRCAQTWHPFVRFSALYLREIASSNNNQQPPPPQPATPFTTTATAKQQRPRQWQPQQHIAASLLTDTIAWRVICSFVHLTSFFFCCSLVMYLVILWFCCCLPLQFIIIIIICIVCVLSAAVLLLLLVLLLSRHNHYVLSTVFPST